MQYESQIVWKLLALNATNKEKRGDFKVELERERHVGMSIQLYLSYNCSPGCEVGCGWIRCHQTTVKLSADFIQMNGNQPIHSYNNHSSV